VRERAAGGRRPARSKNVKQCRVFFGRVFRAAPRALRTSEGRRHAGARFSGDSLNSLVLFCSFKSFSVFD